MTSARQAAGSSNQNPPPIEMFSLAGIEDALGGGGGGGAAGGAAGGAVVGGGGIGGEVAPAAEQETARDLRCHGAAEPRYQGRYQDLVPPPVRYQEYQETAEDLPPPPPAPSCPTAPGTHDKYQDLGNDGDIPYGAVVSEHARAVPRTNARYRSAGECHEMAGAYGGGASGALVPASGSGVSGGGPGGIGDVQYMVVMKRTDNTGGDDKLTPVGAADPDDRRVDSGQTPGLQYMVYEYSDPGAAGGGGGGGSVYSEQPGTMAQCRFELPRRLVAESLPADSRYSPPPPPPPVESRGLQLSTRQSRDQAVCYLPADARVPSYEPGVYQVCENGDLQPVATAPGADQAGGLLYQPADGRRAEFAKLEPDQQDGFGEQQGRFGEDQERFGEEQARFAEMGQGRFGETDQQKFGEVAQVRFVGTDQGRFNHLEQARQMEQARFEQLEQTRFEQAEIARFEQCGQARLDEAGQGFDDQPDPLSLEPPAAPLPPPPPPPPSQPLPMPAKKRKLDPGLAEELRNIEEQELRAIHEQGQQTLQEQELRALHEPAECQTISDQELRAIQEQELRTGHGYDVRPPQESRQQEQERGQEISEQSRGMEGPRAGSTAAKPPADALHNVNLSPKKKRLHRQMEQPPARVELNTAETTGELMPAEGMCCAFFCSKFVR